MGSWLSGLGSALLDVWYFEVSLVALLTFWLLDWLRVCLLDLSEQLGRHLCIPHLRWAELL